MSDRRRMVELGAWIAAALMLAPFFTFELVYRYVLRDVVIRPLPVSDAPMLFRNALWVEAGERPGGGVERVWLGNLIHTDWRAPQPAGFRVAEQRLAWQRAPRRLTGRFFIGVWLSRHATEPELKGAYAATAYFGRAAYGTSAAAQAFFGKRPEELDVAEIATLAAQLQRPSRDPYCDESVANHRLWLLRQMTGSGLLDAKTAITAASEPVRLLPVSCPSPHPPPGIQLDAP